MIHVYLKCYYWADWILSSGCSTLNEEWMEHSGSFDFVGWHFDDVQCEYLFPEKSFDILFYNYGGTLGCDSIINLNHEQILEDAESHPSRLYVMMSRFTSQAMDDYLNRERSENRPKNIFLNSSEFIEYLEENAEAYGIEGNL